MEQLVILVIIGLVSLVNWVVQKSQEKREQAKAARGEKHEIRQKSRRNIYTQPPATPQARPYPATPERNPLEELMEALGLPQDAVPPVIHREFAPTPSVRPPPIEAEEFASLEVQEPTPSRKQQLKKIRRPDENEARLARAFTGQNDAKHPQKNAPSIKSLLSNRTSQQQAVILAEILGRPRAFASLDEPKSFLQPI